MISLNYYVNFTKLLYINNKISKKEILEALELVALIEDKDKKVGKYSLGMRESG